MSWCKVGDEITVKPLDSYWGAEVKPGDKGVVTEAPPCKAASAKILFGTKYWWLHEEACVIKPAAIQLYEGAEQFNPIAPCNGETGDTQKKDAGKLRFDLIPPGPLAELAKVYTIGAAKYADNGWKKGVKWGRVYAAMCRHLFKWWCGEKYDPIDGQHHLSAVAWGCFTLMWYEENGKGEDDRGADEVAGTLGVNAKG